MTLRASSGIVAGLPCKHSFRDEYGLGKNPQVARARTAVDDMEEVTIIHGGFWRAAGVRDRIRATNEGCALRPLALLLELSTRFDRSPVVTRRSAKLCRGGRW